jgi:hypothetical protein
MSGSLESRERETRSRVLHKGSSICADRERDGVGAGYRWWQAVVGRLDQAAVHLG